MNIIEWKKINYIFSVNGDIKESIQNLKLTEESILFVDNFIKSFKNDVLSKMNEKNMSLEDKKKVLSNYLKEVPTGLMILRNHIKNCTYSNTLADYNFKFDKYVLDDIQRLSYIKHS